MLAPIRASSEYGTCSMGTRKETLWTTKQGQKDMAEKSRHFGLGEEYTCPVCGKKFLKTSENWAYQCKSKIKNRDVFCSWKCLCDYREDKTGNRMGKGRSKTKAYDDMLERDRKRHANLRNGNSSGSDLHRADDQSEGRIERSE